jgi:hypothetical protein
MNHIFSFKLFTESVRNFSYLLDKDELTDYPVEKIDEYTYKDIYKTPQAFDTKERKYILLYTKGSEWLPSHKTPTFFTYSPIRNINYRIEKYHARLKGESHILYFIKVSKGDEQSIYYSTSLISCFKKMDELTKLTKKVLKDWL